MLFWILFMAVVFAFSAGALAYLAGRMRRFAWVQKIAGGRRAAQWLIGAALVLLPAAALWLAWGTMNALICVLHLALFWLLCELMCALICRARKKAFRRYYAGAAALLLTALYLSVGWVQAHDVWQKDYAIETDKPVGSLRVALIADSHIDTTFDGEGFADKLAPLQAQSPDVVVLTGDFVDEGTTEAEMRAAARALGNLDAPFGVYFVFGNHDKGVYSNGRRGYGAVEVIEALEENGVTVLQDETALIDDRFYLIGRQDASEAAGRADMAALTQGLDADKFSIVLDHQPHDYAAQAASGVDLVLSGHTHGGQMIPLMQLIELFKLGGDDSAYGLKHIGDTDFIVTSGISDWEILFKTGCRSEFVIIDIEGK